MAGNKRKLRTSPEKKSTSKNSKKSKVCEEEITQLETPIKIENFEEDVETIHDTSDEVEVSEDSGTQDDETDWNPNMSQFFDAQLLVDEDEALSDDSDIESGTEEMTQDDDEDENDEQIITHENTNYMVLKMTRYCCTVCNTSYSLQSNCLHHVDTMHPELSTSYEYVQAKICKVYQCETCREMKPSLQSVHKHSAVCGKSPPQSPKSEKDDEEDSVYDPSEGEQSSSESYTSSISNKSQVVEDEAEEIETRTPEEDLLLASQYSVKEFARFQCNKCKKHFKNHQSCTTHFKTSHSSKVEAWEYIDAVNIKMYTCKKCNKDFSSVDAIAKHIQGCGVTVKSEIKTLHKCLACLNYFPAVEHECKGEGGEVVRTHSMVMKKMVRCPVCERLFPRPENYVNHFNAKHAEQGVCPSVEMKEHTFGKCHICTSWSFHATEQLLVEHMLRHSILASDINIEVVQPVVRPRISMPKSNTGKIRANDEMGTHSIQIKKVATCPVCNKVLSHAFKCKKHIKKTHPQQEELKDSIVSLERKVYMCHSCSGKEGRMFPCMTLLALHLLKHKIVLSDEDILAQLTPSSHSSEKNSPQKTNRTDASGDKKMTHSIEMKKVSMCPVCTKIISQAGLCRNHIKARHPQEDVEALCSEVTKTLRPVYVCHVCPGHRMFHSITLMAQHLLNHCITLSDEDIVTHLRQNEAYKIAALETEVITDTKQTKKKKVSTENKSMSEAEHVITDSGTHTIEAKRVVACPVCSKIFSQVCNCKGHIKNKHTEKDVELECSKVTKTLQTVSICRVCKSKEGKMFPDIKHLALHMLKHKITISEKKTKTNSTPKKQSKANKKEDAVKSDIKTKALKKSSPNASKTDKEKNNTNNSTPQKQKKASKKDDTAESDIKTKALEKSSPKVDKEKINTNNKTKQNKKNTSEKSSPKKEIKAAKSTKKDNLLLNKKAETSKKQIIDKKIKVNIPKVPILKLKIKNAGKKSVVISPAKVKKASPGKKKSPGKKAVVMLRKLDLLPEQGNSSINVKNFKHK